MPLPPRYPNLNAVAHARQRLEEDMLRAEAEARFEAEKQRAEVQENTRLEEEKQKLEDKIGDQLHKGLGSIFD